MESTPRFLNGTGSSRSNTATSSRPTCARLTRTRARKRSSLAPTAPRLRPTSPPSGMQDAADHWESAYANHGGESVSWYQATPRMSLELFDALDVGRDVGVIDIGGGASRLVDELVAKGFADVSVLDLSGEALAETRRRLGQDVSVDWVQADVLAWTPQRRYGLWHDRALFHFLVDPDDRKRYLQTLRSAVEDNGAVVLATFALDGPPTCSGLPVVGYSADDLAELLGAGFEPVDAHREEHVTPRGSIQPFTWVAGRMRGASRPTPRRSPTASSRP